MKKAVLVLFFAAVALAPAQEAFALREFEPGITLVDTDELKGMIDRKTDMLLVNTLSPILFRDKSIPGSFNIPYESLVRGTARLPAEKNRMMVFYCLGFE